MSHEEKAPAGTSVKTDLDRAQVDQWPLSTFPIANAQPSRDVQVVVRRSVLNEVYRHAQGSSHVEICGVLVGNAYRDVEGRAFVYIEAAIRGEHAGSQLAQVTFTSETWDHIHRVMDRDHAGKRILGWYHSHPGFGIFLSGMDRFIHDNFFNGPEQVALVYDPHSGEEGLFLWREGEPVEGPFLLVEDVDEIVLRHVSSPRRPRISLASAVSINKPSALKLRTVRWTLGSILGLCVVLLAVVAWRGLRPPPDQAQTPRIDTPRTKTPQTKKRHAPGPDPRRPVRPSPRTEIPVRVPNNRVHNPRKASTVTGGPERATTAVRANQGSGSHRLPRMARGEPILPKQATGNRLPMDPSPNKITISPHDIARAPAVLGGGRIGNDGARQTSKPSRAKGNLALALLTLVPVVNVWTWYQRRKDAAPGSAAKHRIVAGGVAVDSSRTRGSSNGRR